MIALAILSTSIIQINVCTVAHLLESFLKHENMDSSTVLTDSHHAHIQQINVSRGEPARRGGLQKND